MRPLEAQLALRRKLLAAARKAPHHVAKNGRRLPAAFLFTDPARTPDPVAIVRRLPAGWGVVYRHFGAEDRLAVGRQLAKVCRRRRLILLVSADPGLARQIGADGVHWPERRLPRLSAIRDHGVRSASAHTRAGIGRAARMGADLIFLSVVFASSSPSASTPMGARLFQTLSRTAKVPVYALGGVSADNAARLQSGWAAIEGVMDAWG